MHTIFRRHKTKLRKKVKRKKAGADAAKLVANMYNKIIRVLKNRVKKQEI